MDEIFTELINELMTFVYLSIAMTDITSMTGNGRSGSVLPISVILFTVENLQIQLREPITVLD